MVDPDELPQKDKSRLKKTEGRKYKMRVTGRGLLTIPHRIGKPPQKRKRKK